MDDFGAPMFLVFDVSIISSFFSMIVVVTTEWWKAALVDFDGWFWCTDAMAVPL